MNTTAHLQIKHAAIGIVTAGALIITILCGTARAAELNPDDVSVGKPADISQELFVQIRKACAKLWPDEYRYRLSCEKLEFEAIRKLTGATR